MSGTTNGGTTHPLLRLTGIVKAFPGVRALDGVDLEVQAGEVHCLLGQNGAGKSTLIKVLSGAHQPDAGEIEWRGDHLTLPTPQAAMKRGVAAIYQELDLVDGLSVAENVYLGHEPRTFGVPHRQAMWRHTTELLARLGHAEIPPTQEVGTLSSAGKQIVSIARALSHDARLLIMDEPSAVLAGDETTNLFRVIRDLSADGVAVVYISHRLEEIREIGDRITVLKDGRTVARNLPARTTPTPDLVRLMTGRQVEYVFPPATSRDFGAELLRVEGLTRRGEFRDVTFSVRAGEVVGIAGLVGAGRSELLETVYGRRRPDVGRVLVDGRPLRRGSVGAAVRVGLGLAPEERKSQALILDQPVSHNVTLATLRRFSTFGLLRRGREHAEATRVTRSLDVRPDDVRRPMRTLSGGNQQKTVVGRWLLGGSRLLLLDEPTRGVDVGARAELYALIRRLAADGVGVLLVSSEVPEVLGLADRVLLLKDGGIVHEGRAADLDEHQVLDTLMEGRVATSGTAIGGGGGGGGAV
ncbi:sugar ABC transporter ATP-binding protein [Actinopolymorpha sp. B9G3]|uniref:sugar ABC transporter ATP-binding protein n=1 Tax=Actinopolymorpha sp. B9G3 TaxID=3158970 RepID=UPI0032D98EA9